MKRLTALMIAMLLVLTGTVTAFAETDGAEFGMLNVPQIRITTEEGNGASLLKADGYVNAHIVITDTDSSVLEDDVLFKVRGNSTAMDSVDKKPFTFKFSKKKDVLGLGKGKKWALLANAFDPTLLRNDIANHLAHTMGMPYTSNQRYVELWLDDSYRGCYQLFEPVEQGKDRVDIDITSNNGKKDFLLEFESWREEEGKSYFTVDGLRFLACDPDEPTEEQLAYMTETMQTIVDTLKNGSEEQIRAAIDVDSFAKYYLLNEYMRTLDFDSTSVKFFFKSDKLYAGPAWDYDLSAGNISDKLNTSRYIKAITPEGIHAIDKNLYIYLGDKAWFIDAVRGVYATYYDDFAQVTADGGLIDSEYEQYAELFARNYSPGVWNVARPYINIQKRNLPTYQQNLSYMKNWLSERCEWMDYCYEPNFTPYICGDADGDGELSVLDATAIQRRIADLPVNRFRRRAADNNGDGVDVLDATAVQRHIAKLPSGENIGTVVDTFTLGK